MVDRLNSLMVRALVNAQSSLRREDGQAIAEYALILALIAVVAAVALGTLGTNLFSKLGTVASKIGP